MSINDAYYDKLKLLYKFCKINHFITKHASEDAKKEHDEQFEKFLKEITPTLQKYIQQLDTMIKK